MNKKTYDHLGNEYNSVNEMCDAWRIPQKTYSSRRARGWDLKDVLERPRSSHAKACVDPITGEAFPSLSAMSREHDVPPNTYLRRIHQGWTPMEALSGKRESHRRTEAGGTYTDHMGQVFPTKGAMPEHWNVSYTTFFRREKNGCTLKEALTGYERPRRRETRGKQCTDHLGRSFSNEKDMCKANGVNYQTFKRRLKAGYSVTDALTASTTPFECQDHLGNVFPSAKALCRHWHTRYERYQGRIASGWSVEEALTIPRTYSFGESRIAIALRNHGARYIHDRSIGYILKQFFGMDGAEIRDFLGVYIKECAACGVNISEKRARRLRFDFTVMDDACITGFIEYDGKQHFKYVEFFFKTAEKFLLRHTADMSKNALTEAMGIPLLRVREDQMEEIDEIVADFLNNPARYVFEHNPSLSHDAYWEDYRKEASRLMSCA